MFVQGTRSEKCAIRSTALSLSAHKKALLRPSVDEINTIMYCNVKGAIEGQETAEIRTQDQESNGAASGLGEHSGDSFVVDGCPEALAGPQQGTLFDVHKHNVTSILLTYCSDLGAHRAA